MILTARNMFYLAWWGSTVQKDNLYDDFNLKVQRFLVWPNYLVDIYLELHKGNLSLKLTSRYW